MKTQVYNPSPIEVDFARAIESLSDQLEGMISNNKIEKVEAKFDVDNPILLFHLVDEDGDKHQVVVKVIQKQDIF